MVMHDILEKAGLETAKMSGHQVPGGGDRGVNKVRRGMFLGR